MHSPSDVWVLLAAFGLDLMLGDPRGLPHPVRGFGWLLSPLESIWRRTSAFLSARVAGTAFALSAVGLAAGCVATTMALAAIHSVSFSVVAVYWTYSLLAVRDLDAEAMTVIDALKRGHLGQAREMLGRIVGRDTAGLDEGEILRAVIETVGENLSDAIVAPLLYFGVGGPVAMAAYKAVNTLDSMVGYRNERYREFGWASARLDDALNYIPARATALLIWLAAGLLGLDARASVRVVLRDASQQPSPNAGFPEAAVAGALGVRLGGLNLYQGRPSRKPPLGDAVAALSLESFAQTRRLLYATALLALGFTAILTLGRSW